jgi:hypothetical protein
MQHLKISTRQSTRDERQRTIPQKKSCRVLACWKRPLQNNNTRSYFETKNSCCHIKTNHFKTNNAHSHLNTNLSNQRAFSLMNSDMLATTRPQMSAQQRMRRLKNKIFSRAYCNGNEMTADEEERGCRLQLACLKKNEKQRKHNRRTAGEKMKPENMCLTVTDGCKGEKVAAVKQRERNCWTAGEKMKSENLSLTVTDGCEGETVAAVKVKALCCFEGCNNQIRAGGVYSRHGAKQIRTCSKEGCTKQAQSRGVCVAHSAKTKLCR